MTLTMPEPVPGEVWDLERDPQIGREQGGRRPALVHSNDVSNRLPNGRCFVAPITGTDRGLRIHLRLAPPEGGLSKPSVIVCDQAGATSLLRFKRRRGVVSPETLAAVQTMLGEFIDR